MSELIRKENESIKKYKLRLFRNKDILNIKSKEIADLINNETENNFNESTYRKWFSAYEEGYTDKEKEIIENSSDDKILKEYELKQRELYKERQKLRDEKNEYSAWLREQSRIELFYERIDEAVERIVNKKNRIIPKPILKDDINDDKIVVSFADPHYGAYFKIEGFDEVILNEYNPEIFEQRMWKLRDEILEFCEIHNVKNVSIIDLGDSIEGILHLSQLKSLRGNIVDDILDYADFITDWISDLSQKLYIDFYTSEGNHSDLRLLTGKKGDFPHENLERIYTRTIKKAFKINPNVDIHKSLDGLNYFNVNGYNILTAHGNKEGNLKNSIKDYEDTYKIDIDYFIVGHLHSKNEFEISKGKEVIQVRALMGINEYSKDIKKTSDAGATMFVVRKNYGRKYVNEVKFK